MNKVGVRTVTIRRIDGNWFFTNQLGKRMTSGTALRNSNLPISGNEVKVFSRSNADTWPRNEQSVEARYVATAPPIDCPYTAILCEFTCSSAKYAVVLVVSLLLGVSIVVSSMGTVVELAGTEPERLRRKWTTPTGAELLRNANAVSASR